jgi:hypothetical protein
MAFALLCTSCAISVADRLRALLWVRVVLARRGQGIEITEVPLGNNSRERFRHFARLNKHWIDRRIILDATCTGVGDSYSSSSQFADVIALSDQWCLER